MTTTIEFGHLEFGYHGPYVVSTVSGYIDLTSPGGVTRQLLVAGHRYAPHELVVKQRPDLFRQPASKDT